jgi:two-component system, LytTR family, sensor kinase
MSINQTKGLKTLLLHGVFWLGYLALMVFVFASRIPIEKALPRTFLFILPQIILAYVNMSWLVPKYFFKKRYLEYFLILLVLLAVFYFLMEYLAEHLLRQSIELKEISRNRSFRPNGEPPFLRPRAASRMVRGLLSVNVLLTLAVVFLSTAYKVSQFATLKEKEATQLRNANLDAELKFLKSQINPHFLFNALNNVYALSVIKSDKTPGTVLKLSEILRYLLYDCAEEKVPLLKEITYLQNYIDLQKLKDEQLGELNLNIEVADPQVMIEPMLLIPFVENSFKHSGIENPEEGWIKIDLQMSPGSRLLQFSIRNSMPQQLHSKDKTGGIGLENVRRRLQLLYPDRHELVVQQNQQEFSVILNLFL